MDGCAALTARGGGGAHIEEETEEKEEEGAAAADEGRRFSGGVRWRTPMGLPIAPDNFMITVGLKANSELSASIRLRVT